MHVALQMPIKLRDESLLAAGHAVTSVPSSTWIFSASRSRSCTQSQLVSGETSVHTTHTVADTTMATMLPASAGPVSLVVAMVSFPAEGHRHQRSSAWPSQYVLATAEHMHVSRECLHVMQKRHGFTSFTNAHSHRLLPGAP